MAIFLAVQYTRTAMHRERVMFPVRFAEYAGDQERTRELMAGYLHQVHLGFRPEAGEVQAAWDSAVFALQDPEALSKDAAIRLSMSTVEPCAAVLQQRHWRLEVTRKPRFITSDAPLVLWRPPCERDRYEGFGLTLPGGRAPRSDSGEPVDGRVVPSEPERRSASPLLAQRCTTTAQRTGCAVTAAQCASGGRAMTEPQSEASPPPATCCGEKRGGRLTQTQRAHHSFRHVSHFPYLKHTGTKRNERCSCMAASGVLRAVRRVVRAR
nr:hypothetical protein GCM10020063_009580 [Dactylosporangium thailandense]